MLGMIIDPKSGDLMVREGHIAVGDIERQGIEQILVSNRGEYKEYPLIGGEVLKMLHGEESRFWANRARSMCRAMGIDIRRASVEMNGKIRIEI